MRTAPYDTSLEQVLPGVQSRFDSLNSNLNLALYNLDILVAEIQRQKEIMETLLQAVAWHNERSIRTLMARILAAGSLAASPQYLNENGESEGEGVPLDAARSVTNPPSAAAIIGLEGEQVPGNGHRLPSRPTSARDIWNMWFGLGEYENKPVPGGVAQLEAERRTQWRKGYTVAEKKKLSQYRNAVRYMCEEQEVGHDEENPVSLATFLDGMDNLFLANKSLLSPFVEALKKRAKERAESMQ